MQRSIPSTLRRLAVVGLDAVWLFTVPPALTSGYLWISRSQQWWTPATDCVVLALSILVGSAGIIVLPISRFGRAVMFLPYAVAMIILLFFWMLSFVCAFFGDCL